MGPSWRTVPAAYGHSAASCLAAVKEWGQGGCCWLADRAIATAANPRPQVRAAVPMYLLSRRIKAMGEKVVLSGEGADEIFGGYLYFHKAPNRLVRTRARGHGAWGSTAMGAAWGSV